MIQKLGPYLVLEINCFADRQGAEFYLKWIVFETSGKENHHLED